MKDLSHNTIDPATKLVLIVEDDGGVREILEFAVRREGFRVDSAKNGAEALEKIRTVPPDLVLLDLMMPGTGGFDVLRELQTAAARVPVAVMTGRYTDASNEAMIRQEANVVAFMQKPIRPASLAVFLHGFLKTMAPELKRHNELEGG